MKEWNIHRYWIFTFLCLFVLHLSLFMEQGTELELVMLACALLLDRGLFIITLRTRRPGRLGINDLGPGLRWSVTSSQISSTRLPEMETLRVTSHLQSGEQAVGLSRWHSELTGMLSDEMWRHSFHFSVSVLATVHWYSARSVARPSDWALSCPCSHSQSPSTSTHHTSGHKHSFRKIESTTSDDFYKLKWFLGNETPD